MRKLSRFQRLIAGQEGLWSKCEEHAGQHFSYQPVVAVALDLRGVTLGSPEHRPHHLIDNTVTACSIDAAADWCTAHDAAAWTDSDSGASCAAER